MDKTMTAIELAKLADAVFRAQRDYFDTRSTVALVKSKALESHLRRAVATVLSRQPSLFDGEPES